MTSSHCQLSSATTTPQTIPEHPPRTPQFPNCFLLFRTQWYKDYRARFPDHVLTMSEVSKQAAKEWRSLSHEMRGCWRRFRQQKKAERERKLRGSTSGEPELDPLEALDGVATFCTGYQISPPIVASVTQRSHVVTEPEDEGPTGTSPLVLLNWADPSTWSSRTSAGALETFPSLRYSRGDATYTPDLTPVDESEEPME